MDGQRSSDLPPCAAAPPLQPSIPLQPQYPDGPSWPPENPPPPPRPPSPPPVSCPRLPPYPGVSSIQVLECDVEYPEPDVCGLSLFNGARLRLQPGQALAVRYRNLDSPAAQLSRLIISAERMTFELLQQQPSAAGGSSQRLLIVSGLCPDQLSLTTCLHGAYHGAPQYRACGQCFGINMVSELAEGEGDDPWVGGGGGGGGVPLAGDASTLGDTSYFRNQLLTGGGSDGDDEGDGVLYFLASMSSGAVQLTYSRTARVLYMPGSQVSYLQPRNRSFENVTALPTEGPPPGNSNSGGSGSGRGEPVSTGGGDSGGGSSSSSSSGTAGPEPTPGADTREDVNGDGSGSSNSNTSSSRSSDSNSSSGEGSPPPPPVHPRPLSPPPGLPSYRTAGGGAAAATTASASGAALRWLLALAALAAAAPLGRARQPAGQ